MVCDTSSALPFLPETEWDAGGVHFVSQNNEFNVTFVCGYQSGNKILEVFYVELNCGNISCPASSPASHLLG